MSFINWIIEKLSDIGMWFCDLAVESWDAFYIPNVIGNLFYDIHGFFVGLAWDFVDFNEWVDSTVDRLGDILSWSNIRSLIRQWLPDLEDVIDWWDRWWVWVGQEIDDWWDSVRYTVLDWIDDARDYAWLLVRNVENWLDNLQSSWDYFRVTTLPNLADWSGVDSLIDSWFRTFTPFWEGWQDVRTSVVEFISDPLGWLYNKLDEFFERFW